MSDQQEQQPVEQITDEKKFFIFAMRNYFRKLPGYKDGEVYNYNVQVKFDSNDDITFAHETLVVAKDPTIKEIEINKDEND